MHGVRRSVEKIIGFVVTSLQLCGTRPCDQYNMAEVRCHSNGHTMQVVAHVGVAEAKTSGCT